MTKRKYPERKSSYQRLSSAFRSVIDNFKIAASKTDKRETTIQAEANNGSAFLLCLQDQGAKTLNDVTTTMIQKFFFDGERQIRGHTYKNNIVAVLKGNREFDTWAECKRIINSVPPIRRSRKNYPYLHKDELDIIKSELSTGTLLSLRDKAIMTLLIHTGIRGADIAKMSMTNIDWKADRMNIRQSKTDAPLCLPLTATVGNAIYDYIKYERQNKMGMSNLFLNTFDIKKQLKKLHMKKIITQALLIALPYSFLVSVLFYTLTINFFAVSPGEPSEIVYYGFDAVRHMIREYGLVNYLAGILPHYIFFGCSILIALIIQGIINGKPKNA